MRRYNRDSKILPYIVGVFGWVGMVGYLLVNPYTSALEAKDRLKWCVKTRRNGGYWMEAGERKRLYRQGGQSGPIVAQYKQSARWVSAVMD